MTTQGPYSEGQNNPEQTPQGSPNPQNPEQNASNETYTGNQGQSDAPGAGGASGQTSSMGGAAGSGAAGGGTTGSGATGGPSSAGESTTDRARAGANAAASALRRGEFMHDANVDPEADRDDRLIAMLAYVTQILIPLIMPVIILLSESSKKRPFQRYHAVQSLGLALVFIALAAALAIGTAVIQVIPLVGTLVGLLMVCLTPILMLMAWVALGYYGYQAYQGKHFAIPGLTSILRDQGWTS